jgi:hypothetical protein
MSQEGHRNDRPAQSINTQIIQAAMAMTMMKVMATPPPRGDHWVGRRRRMNYTDVMDKEISAV